MCVKVCVYVCVCKRERESERERVRESIKFAIKNCSVEGWMINGQEDQSRYAVKPFWKLLQ